MESLAGSDGYECVDSVGVGAGDDAISCLLCDLGLTIGSRGETDGLGRGV